MDKKAERFADLFQGFGKAYGQFEVKRTNEKGKKEGRAITVRGEPAEEQWLQHLEGTGAGLGIIPLTDENTVNFAVIDIDVYDLDFEKLEKDIEEKGFPLFLFKSKSGGAHLYIFFSVGADAALVRGKLSGWAATLGFGGSEVFPKQDYRTTEDDLGNWINLPYYKAADTTRAAILKGKVLSFDEFLDEAENMRIVPDDLTEIKTSAERADDNDPEKWFVGASPCLKRLLVEPMPEGYRNDTVFRIARYLKKRFPDEWEEKTVLYNTKFLSPPLPLKEVMETVIKSMRRKDYDAKCDGPFCDPKACSNSKFGKGQTANDKLRISHVTKYDSEPAYWVVEVEGGARLRMDTDTFYSQSAFNKKCMEQINRCPASISKVRWEQELDRVLQKNMDVVPVPSDASDGGQFVEHVMDYCGNQNMQAKDVEEILMGKPWRDKETGFIHFRSKDLIQFLTDLRFRYANTAQIYHWLREKMGAGETRLTIKGIQYRVWAINDFDKPIPNENPQSSIKESEF